MLDLALPRYPALAAVCLLSFLSGASCARAEATVIEQMIAKANPCSALKLEQSGFAIGIDKLESVTVRRASLTIEGALMRADLDGRLACRTSSAAVMQGGAAADVRGSASLALSNCSVESLSIDLTSFSGEFGPTVELLEPVIVEGLTSQAREEMLSICRAVSIAVE